MNIVFMGTPEYAKTILEGLVSCFNVSDVFANSDKKVGRKGIITPPATKKFIIDNKLNIKIHQPKTLRDECVINDIKGMKPDFIVVAAYGKILPKEILDIAPCINLHASILPDFRGASPIQSMLLRGDKYLGVTAMRMGVGLDDGDILGFSYIENLDYDEDVAFVKLANIARDLLIDVLNSFEKIEPIPQNHAIKTACKKINKEDGIISFDDDVFLVKRKFKAFYVWPNIFFDNGVKLVKVGKIIEGNFPKGVITRISKESFYLGFSGGLLEILEIQEPSKPKVLAREFLNGKRKKDGDRIFG